MGAIEASAREGRWPFTKACVLSKVMDSDKRASSEAVWIKSKTKETVRNLESLRSYLAGRRDRPSAGA